MNNDKEYGCRIELDVKYLIKALAPAFTITQSDDDLEININVVGQITESCIKELGGVINGIQKKPILMMAFAHYLKLKNLAPIDESVKEISDITGLKKSTAKEYVRYLYEGFPEN